MNDIISILLRICTAGEASQPAYCFHHPHGGGGTPHFSLDLACLSPGARARATSPAGQLQCVSSLRTLDNQC